jgi:hypothetical protein
MIIYLAKGMENKRDGENEFGTGGRIIHWKIHEKTSRIKAH